VALHALADPTRRRIFEALRNGPVSVGALADRVPVSRPAVSQHLKVLREAGLVREEREGTRRNYRADPEGLRDLRRWLDGMWGDVLGAFKEAADAEAGRGPRRRRKSR
jgi:DNA-binding transcriptional ArsR family regulator